MEELFQILADILEVDNITNDDILEEFDCWDSLTILSIISMASEKYNKKLSAKDIREAYTVEDLYKVILN
jgi:acyl carrier protein